MDLKKAIWALVLPALALTACNDDEGATYNDREVRFNSFVKGATKVHNSTWETNDQVGLYMIKSGSVLSEQTIVNDANNKKYVTTTGNGNFQGLNTNETVFYPEKGTVDFISYYPQTDGLHNFTFPIDVLDQTNPNKLDLLYSNNAKEKDATSNTTLMYEHQLTRVVFSISSIDGNAELAGLGVTLKGFKTKGSFFLPDGTLALIDDSKKDIEANVSHVAGGGAIAEAILLPEAGIKDAIISFVLPGAGTFDHKIASLTLNGGTQLNYTVKLNNTEGNNSVVVVSSNITPWTEQNGGTIDVDFNPNGGTEEPNPNPNPDPTNKLVFKETFGKDVQKGQYWPSVDIYKGWDNQNLTFSDPAMTGSYSNASVRKTSTMDPHVWFAANKDSKLKIEGFSTAEHNTLTLSYDITFNQPSGATGNGTQNAIKVYVDDKELTVPNQEIAKDNTYETVTLTGIPTGFKSITFSSEAAVNTKGYRIDNITLSGE